MQRDGVGIGRNKCFVCFARKAQHGAELKAGYEALLMLIHNETGIVDSEQDSSLVHVKIEKELYAMTYFEALFEIFWIFLCVYSFWETQQFNKIRL